MTQDRAQKIIIAVLALLLVVVSGGLVNRMLTSKTDTPAPVAVVPTENQNANVNEYSNPNPDNTPEPTPGHDIVNAKTVEWLTTTERFSAAQISKKYGIKISELSVPDKPRHNDGNYSGTYGLQFERLGSVKGEDLYSIAQSCVLYMPPDFSEMDGPGPSGAKTETVPDNCIDFYAFARFDAKLKKFMVYGDHSRYVTAATVSMLPPPLDKTSKVIWDKLPDLSYPNTVNLAGGYSLGNTDVKIYPNPDWDSDRQSYVLTGTSMDGTNIYLRKPGEGPYYYLLLPMYGFIGYDLNIPFFQDGRIPQLTWNDGTVNATDYSRAMTGGCGGRVGTNLISPDDAQYFSDRFALAGKTTNNDPVYIPKRTDNPLIADTYRSSIFSSDYGIDSPTEKISFEKFALLKPIFVTDDPFGNRIVWTRADAMPMAECGKPVVYLYPTKTEQVSVKLGNNIEVTKSEPAYGKGWKVTAAPNGTLTTADGKTFPYLYWDGNGASYNAPTTGFVVASKDVEATFKSKLAQLGLNAKEISDFNEFWVPIVSKSPYALISFVPQEEWSKAAPLSISPAPETVIRVFMDWKPLSAPVTVEPQILPPTPVRTGFTAVEWGGLLYK